MSDEDKTGGTPETEEKGGEDKVYTEADVQTLVGKAKEDGKTESWRHFQSESDKKISVAKTQFEAESKVTGEKLAELQRARLDGMSPEERNQAMMETVYERLTSPAVPEKSTADKPNSTEDAPGPGSDSGTMAQARDEVGAALKEMGIDAEKVDWAEGVGGPEAMKRFLKSIVDQNSDKTKNDLEKEEEEKEANRTDGSRSAAGGGFDFLKGDPSELILQGAKENPRIRGG